MDGNEFKKYPMINKEETGNMIKKLMEEKGVSVLDLQAYLYLESPQAIYAWLSARNIPSIDHLYALAHFFQVPIDYIVCGNMSKDVEDGL